MKSAVPARRSREQVRRSLRKSVLATVTLLVAVVSLAACTNETKGTATPGGSGAPSESSRPTIPGGGTASSDRPSPSKTGSSGESPVAGTDPCELLTSADVAALAVGPSKGEKGLDSTSRACVWNSTDQGEYTIRVQIFDTRGLKEIQASGPVEQLSGIGKHKAVRYPFGTLCAVGIAITETSRVEATGASGNNKQRACQVATQVAQLIEPKLPGGS